MCLAGRSGSAVGVGQDQSTLLLLHLRDAVRVVRFLILLFSQHYLHFVHLAKFTTTVYMKYKKSSMNTALFKSDNPTAGPQT
jgi:hypothetical protein